MLGHVVPGDFAQEVVAARSMRDGTALYPHDVNATVREWLVAEPPAVPAWLPGPPARWLAAAQQRGRNRLVAQAHPPTLLLAAAPGILVLGGYGAFWVLTVVTVAVAALTATVLVTALAPAASRRERILAVLALVSWQPVLATVRDGQVSVLIGGLLVLAWADLRRGRDSRAGALVGSAAALKLYPLLLLVLLALRRRRACAAAALVDRRRHRSRCCGPWAGHVGSVRGIRTDNRVVVRGRAVQPFPASEAAGRSPRASGWPSRIQWQPLRPCVRRC